MQMPDQFEAVWNTSGMDFLVKRLYREVLSVAPVYEVWLGFAEFIAGFLLLFRCTTTVGAALAFVVLGNITISNHTYDIGEHVPSALMALLALFVLWQYLPYIYRVLSIEENAMVPLYYPVLSKWQRWMRTGLKLVFNFVLVVLFAWYGVKAVRANDFYKLPNTPGLANVSGKYEMGLIRPGGRM